MTLRLVDRSEPSSLALRFDDADDFGVAGVDDVFDGRGIAVLDLGIGVDEVVAGLTGELDGEDRCGRTTLRGERRI